MAKQPWEKILDLVPVSQRAIARVDDASAARVLRAYRQAREQLSEDLDRLWGRFGTAPTVDEAVRLVASKETLDLLTEREEELRGRSVRAIKASFDAGEIEALKHAARESKVFEEAFPATRFTRPFTPPPGAAEEVGMNLAVQDAAHFAEATRAAASTILTAAALAGDGIDVMKRKLVPVFDGNARRAEITARWAAIKGYNTAANWQYREVQELLAPHGRTVYQMWVAEPDARACPICLALHGSITGLEENFDLTATFATTPPPKPWPDGATLATPPRHARCRCSIVPWVDGWEVGTAFTPQRMRADARARAAASGYSPTPLASPIPTPAGRRLVAEEVRRVPRPQFERAKANYLGCVFPRGVPDRPPS